MTILVVCLAVLDLLLVGFSLFMYYYAAWVYMKAYKKGAGDAMQELVSQLHKRASIPQQQTRKAAVKN